MSNENKNSLPTLTQSGMALMVKALSGESLTFTKMQIGRGKLEKGVDLTSLTSLINPILDIGIEKIERNENNILLKGSGYNNSSIEEDITWNELGIFAKGADDEERLYAIIYTDDYFEKIPKKDSGFVIENNIAVTLVVASSVEVSAIIKSIQYCTVTQLEEHLNANNPHKITAKDINLEKVANCEFEENVVSFETGFKVENLTAGEKIKTTFSKIWALIDAFINHIRADNPHDISTTKINAAEKNHIHDLTSSSVKGILPVEKGGTGAYSIPSFLNNWGLDLARISSHYHNAEGGQYTFENKMRIEWGVTSISAEANSVNYTEVKYPSKYFKVAPIVLATVNSTSLHRHASVTSVTTSGYRIVLQNNTTADTTNKIYYLVIGYLN